jgi:SET and MYND domain-containing protein
MVPPPPPAASNASEPARISSDVQPHSPLFEIKDTPNAGRGVFAAQDIPKDTLLLATESVPVALVLREYRREVCGWCFAYERGRNWKLRDGEANFAFCGEGCLRRWREDVGVVGRVAWVAVEGFVRRKMSVGKAGGVVEMGLTLVAQTVSGASSVETIVSGSDDGDGDLVLPTRPSEADIELAWTRVASTAHFIRQARNGSTAKPHRRAMTSALAVFPDANTMYFLLAGILAHARSDQDSEWPSIVSLVPDPTPYHTAQHLNEHIHSYLQLLSLLPLPLLPSVTAATCLAALRHESRNSFGIRSLDDGGDEFFGWAVWPQASYFNHACAPSVRKRRTGRTWEFWSARLVRGGEELSISYLGGEEESLDVGERRARLSKTWGFGCACGKCVGDGRLFEG